MHLLISGMRAKSVSALMVFLLCMGGLIPAGVSQAAVSDWQKGVSVLPNSSTDFASDGFKQMVSHMKTLGVNYVTLIIPYYQSNVGSTDIGRGWNTPTDDSLIAGIQYVHSQGMRVMLKIQLDPYDGQWRANINPGDRATWYKNYSNLLVQYGKLAQAQGVEEFCIGAELIDMAAATQNSDNTAQWKNMIAQVRGIYSGLLTYSANWGGGSFGDEADHIQFFDALDSIGISAYYELNTDGSVSSLEGAWDGWNKSTIGPLASRWNKPVLFTEVGYKSVSGAHFEPWNSGRGGSYDGTEQANDYQALFSYWNNQPYMEGVQLWDVYANPNAGGSGNIDYTPQNKPAEQVMSQWFNTGGGNTGGGGVVHVAASGSASPSSASAGQSITLTATVNNTGAALTGANVDLEVYQGGTQVFQKIFTGESFAAGQTRTFTQSWTPGSSGTYTFKIGVFNGDWSTLYVWNNSAAQISVSSSGGTPSGPAVIDNWWPVDGAHVSGTQPFKGIVEGESLSQYNLYWQTGAGQRNPMSDSTEGSPHKEADIDLSGWTWLGNGPYPITFTATDKSGTVIATKTFNIYIP